MLLIGILINSRKNTLMLLVQHPTHLMLKILDHADDDALWNFCHNSGAENCLDKSFWIRKFIKEFGERKARIMLSREIDDNKVGNYYFHYKYNHYRGCIGNGIVISPNHLERIVNHVNTTNEYRRVRAKFHFNQQSSYFTVIFESKPTIDLKTRCLLPTRKITLDMYNSGKYVIKGCQTKKEIDYFVGYIVCILSHINA